MVSTPDHSEIAWLDDAAGPVVRPYAIASGRTRSSRDEFDLIALIVATRQVTPADLGLGPEHIKIVELCQQPQSVAEVAAKVDLPLVIVRVLLGDLLDKGVIMARKPQAASELPSENLFKAVIDGIRAL